MIQNIFKSIVISAILCLTITSNAQQIIDKIVAKVGGETVLLSELEEQFSYASANQPGMGEEGKCQILESIIAQNLLVNQAKLDSIEVSDSEVEDQLNFKVERILQQMNGDEKFFEEYYGENVSQVKSRMRTDLKNQILAQRMQMSLLNNVKITPKEIKLFFDKIPTDSLPFLDSEVELAEIVAVPTVNEVEKTKARLQLLELRKQIVDDPSLFGKLAGKYSDDLGSGAKGGDLGFVKRGTFVPAFEAVAYSLKKGELSDLVESEFGFHLIELIERRGNTVHCKHILITPELTEEDLEKAKTGLVDIRNTIIEDSIDYRKAVRKYSFEDAESYGDNGRMKNPQTGNTFFSMGELDPDIYFAISDMKVGDISSVIEFRDARGKTMYHIVKLITKTKPHRASLHQDYAKIEQYAKESKKNIYFNNWIQERLGETYIELDSRYDDCENLKAWRTK